MPTRKVLADNYWPEVRTAGRHADRRMAAVAFVTKDLVGFKRGDTLIVNAARSTIAAGSTSASLLLSLHKRGVKIYSCANLHAKVLMLGRFAAIGSGNMSAESQQGWLEAGLVTDDLVAVAGVQSFLEKLVDQVGPRLNKSALEKLVEIPVAKRGKAGKKEKGEKTARIGKLGNRMWFVSVRELVKDPPPTEQEKIDEAVRDLELPEERLAWIRYTGAGRFRRECVEGDLLVVMFRRNGKPTSVSRPVPALLIQEGEKWTRFYYETPEGARAERSWKAFQSIAKKAGHARLLKDTSTQLVSEDVADQFIELWTGK